VRIIATGCTQLQLGTPPKSNNSIQKIDVPNAIMQALRERGHEVDWRRVEPGEDLSGYDLAWVNLAPINSLNGRQGATGALWALGSGLPCVGFFDDWATSLVFNGMQSLQRNPMAFYKYLISTGKTGVDVAKTHYSLESAEKAIAGVAETDPGAASKLRIERYYMRDNDAQTREHQHALLEQCFAFTEERWRAGMVPVMPMYHWGDRAIIRKRMPGAMGAIEALDPSSTIYDLIAPHEPVDPHEKKREWVLGAIQPHDQWVEKKQPSWDVSYLGSRTAIARHGGQRYKTETDVIKRYNESWGILSPPYPQAGSGWWRSRFMYSAKVRSVLVCDKGEADPLGSAYKYTIPEVESMSTGQLTEVANFQAEALRRFMPTYESFQDHCDTIVQRAVKEDRGWGFNKHFKPFDDAIKKALEENPR
jgi:hypothetical protein